LSRVERRRGSVANGVRSAQCPFVIASAARLGSDGFACASFPGARLHRSDVPGTHYRKSALARPQGGGIPAYAGMTVMGAGMTGPGYAKAPPGGVREHLCAGARGGRLATAVSICAERALGGCNRLGVM